MTVDSVPLLIYDADCGMCARFASSDLMRMARITPIGFQFIEDDPALVRIVRERGIDQRLFSTAMVLIAGERVYVGARAFNAILRRCGAWRAAAGAALSLPIVLLIETLVYRGIAANRRHISKWLGASICAPKNCSPLDSSGGSFL